jgi:hypothetical protein
MFYRFRLVIATILIAFLATWWHNPNQYIVRHFQQLIVEPLCEISKFLSHKLTRQNAGDSTTSDTKIWEHSPDVT